MIGKNLVLAHLHTTAPHTHMVSDTVVASVTKVRNNSIRPSISVADRSPAEQAIVGPLTRRVRPSTKTGTLGSSYNVA